MSADWTEYGEVYTRRWVVDAILDLVGYSEDRDLAGLVLVEPSMGSGAFMMPVVRRLLASATRHNRPFRELAASIRAFDLLPQSVSHTREALAAMLIEHGASSDDTEYLLESWLTVGDFLLTDRVPDQVDFVVGNPPYIRLEEIPEDVTNSYRSLWPTMRGRADIYIGFIERGLSILRDQGALGFICADRWMRNQYGEALRSVVAHGHSIETVWTMHQVDAFETEVDAYPAITVIRNAPQGQAVVADANVAFNETSARELTHWTLGNGREKHGVGYEAHRLDRWFKVSERWIAGRPSLIALMEYLNERFPPLQDPETGTRVSIGVATGADKTFVVKEADVEPDRLLPLSMVRDLRATGEFVWGGNYLVNPWDTNGQLVDPETYPRLMRHFESNPALAQRHTAKKNPNAWYRTIDKVNFAILNRPKLLIQDMRASINPVLESGGKYPHHNLYFVVSDSWDLEVLGGLLLSRIGQAFIEAYGVRMRGGTLRFQAQYLKMIRVPRPEDIRADTAARLRGAFASRDVWAATLAAGDAYGIDVEEYGLVDSEVRLAG